MGIILVSGQRYQRKALTVPKGVRLERVDCIIIEKSDYSVDWRSVSSHISLRLQHGGFSL